MGEITSLDATWARYYLAYFQSLKWMRDGLERSPYIHIGLLDEAVRIARAQETGVAPEIVSLAEQLVKRVRRSEKAKANRIGDQNRKRKMKHRRLK